MIAENPCNTMESAGLERENDHSEKLLPFEFFAAEKARQEAEDANFLEGAEPVLSAVDKLLSSEDLFNRIVIETDVRADVLRHLIDRRPPRRHDAARFDAGSLQNALQRLTNWVTAYLKERTFCDYAETPTLTVLHELFREAMDYGDLKVLIGTYGIGKTEAAKRFVDAFPRGGVRSVRGRPENRGALRVDIADGMSKSEFLGLLSRRLVPDLHGTPRFEVIREELRPGDLLILDEAQRLSKVPSALEIIRDLWEATGAGVVLMGNPHIKKKGPDGIIGNDMYGAFQNRAEIHSLQLTRADVDAWMVWKGWSGKELADRLAAIALRPDGGLRRLVEHANRAKRRIDGELDSREMLAFLKNLRTSA